MFLQGIYRGLGGVSVFAVVLLLNLDRLPELDVRVLVHIMMQFFFMYGLLAYVKKYKILHAVITLFIVVSLAAKLSYDSFLSIGVLMSIVGASSGEMSDFIESNAIAVLVTMLLFIGIVVSPVLPNKKIRVAFISTGLLYTVLPAFFNQDAYSGYFYDHRILSGTSRGLTNSQAHIEYVLLYDIGKRLPVLVSLKGVADTIQFLLTQSDLSSTWTDVSVQENSPDILIIGLGESLRSDHLGIYGYERDTTPLLSKAENLRIYNNVYSGGTNTWASVPAMLTKVSEQADLSKSVISLANDAGYKTFWLSNQTKVGPWDFSVSAIAAQSHHTYFSAGDDTVDIEYDSILLPKLSKILEDREHDQKVLIVLNFYGSHGRFKDRYPESYEKFQGENIRLNHYDNSILYTDYVLSQALDISDRYDAKFIYFSDHGLGDHREEMSLIHDVRDNPHVDSVQVPLLSNSDLNIDLNNITNLFYFECIFSDWSGISAKELRGDYCTESLGDKRITFYDSQLNLLRVSAQL